MSKINIIQQGDKWVAKFSWDVTTKDLVKAAGFRFDGQNKIWWTDNPAIAAKFQDQVDPVREAIAGSRATSADIEIPLSDECVRRGLDYLPYQKAGISFGLNHAQILLADEMGLGKTIQVLGIINSDPSIHNVLIICPASLKLNWQREALLWLANPLPIHFANGYFPSSGMVIINYEQVQKYRSAIDQIKWDLLVADESHYLKNGKAQRTAAVLGKWDPEPSREIKPIQARRRIFLTGTPVLNRPKELWTLVKSLDPWNLGRRWQQFHERYCGAYKDRYGWYVDGATNLDELQNRLRSSFMIRRLKSEVLTELPPKRRQIIVLEPDAAARVAIEAETKFVKETEAKLTALRVEMEKLSVNEASEAYKSAAAKLREAEQVAFTETSLVRHATALSKVPQVIEHLRNCLDGSDEKIVVWAHHHDVLDKISQGLTEYGVLQADGRNTIFERQDAVDKFQKDPAFRVIMCGMTAMGTGWTLTAASHEVFAELDWTPANLAQAEDRCHRIGQKESVLVQHLVLDGSMDCRMTFLLLSKMNVITRALDEGATLPPEKPFVLTPPDAEPELSTDEVAAIHEGLRLLAGMCDGAVALDGHGFNKLDASFGHKLAGLPHLTIGQAKAGRTMVLKYKRQIPPELYDRIKGGKAE